MTNSYQGFRVLNDLSMQVMNMDELKISDRPIKKKKPTGNRSRPNSNTRSNYEFDPAHDIDFREFLERDTGVEFNSSGKMNPCPICGHNDCCSVMPDEPALMMCFSDEHDKAFNIWAYMEQVRSLTEYDAVRYIENVMGLQLDRPKAISTRYKRAPKLKIITAKEMVNDKRPKPEDLIGGGLLPFSSLMVISGKEKSYKSFMSVDMAFHLVAGRDWQGHCISKAYKCIILSAEGGYFPMRERLQRMSSGFKEQIDLDNLLVPEEVSINLLEPDDYALLSQMLKQQQPDVLIFDPLVRFHNGDENASNEMAAVMGILREIIQEFNISIILIHHDTKSGTAMRGSSVIGGEYDSMMHLHANNTNNATSVTVKYSLRHAVNPPDMELQFHPETFSFGQLRKQSSTAQEAIIGFLGVDGLERKELKTVFMDGSNYTDKTFNNELLKMIRKGVIKENGNLLELSS